MENVAIDSSAGMMFCLILGGRSWSYFPLKQFLALKLFINVTVYADNKNPVMFSPNSSLVSSFCSEYADAVAFIVLVPPYFCFCRNLSRTRE